MSETLIETLVLHPTEILPSRPDVAKPGMRFLTLRLRGQEITGHIQNLISFKNQTQLQILTLDGHSETHVVPAKPLRFMAALLSAEKNKTSIVDAAGLPTRDKSQIIMGVVKPSPRQNLRTPLEVYQSRKRTSQPGL